MMKKKFIFDTKELKHINSIFRTRIAEDRNLSKGLRLNRNERVLNFSKNLLSNIFKKTKGYDLAKYPDQTLIYKHLSTYLKLKENNFYITQGIDGAIKNIFEIFTKANDKILCLYPTYAMYEVYSKIFKTKIKNITYNSKTFKLEINDLIDEIKKKPKILFLPNPNQPIEDNLSYGQLDKLCSLCKRNKVVLVIDEAYYMFGSSSAKNLIFKYNNLIVLRTFSKSFGLPSIRLGYVISSSKIIHILKTFRLSYETNFLTDTVAIYFLKRLKLIRSYNNQVKIGREYLSKKIKNLGFDVIGKKSNFLLINFKNENICKNVYKGFVKDLIYVKGSYKYPLNSCLLLTCGPKNLMKKVYLSLKKNIRKY
jgi:histidinol-phosphate aminotransferase